MSTTTFVSIRTKIATGFIVLLLCLGLSSFVLLQRIYSQQEELAYIAGHDMEVLDLANRIEQNVLDMETGQRGYIITGDARYMEPYTTGKKLWLENYVRLGQLISDNPVQQANLERIRSAVEQWIERAGEPTIGMKQSGRQQDLQQFFLSDPGRQLIDQLRGQLEAFRKMEQTHTQDRVLLLEKSNEDLQSELYILMSAATLLSLLIIVLLSGSIIRTIQQVTDTIRSIAGGREALGARIEVRSRDEIRELAAATNELLSAAERENWVKSRIAELAVIHQGRNHPAPLAEAMLNKLAHMSFSSHGVFYLNSGTAETGRLRPIASFAGTGADAAAAEAPERSFAVGEGLVGQAAAEKRILLIHSLPDGYIRIASGLGDAPPRSLLLLPILFEDEVQAVIELASLGEFPPLLMELLEAAREMLGIAVHNVVGHMEIERLYHEAQVLSEELQAQTEELQLQSEELQARQAELMATNHSLRHSEERLQWQKLTLEKQAAELTSISRYKSEFLANMSHELRTPLNSMLILSQLLEENKDGNLTPKQIEFARTIHSSGRDLLRLIDEVLDLSKVEAGMMDVITEQCSLAELTAHLVNSFQPLAEKKGIAFHVDISPELPDTFYTDPHRLQQILRNFLSNAFKFTAKGSVTLHIEGSDDFPGKASGTAESAVLFKVTDTGIGIPEAKLELIFDAFQQVDGSISRRYGGTGLGLTISRELARLLGGSIRAESRERVGSSFTLYLPKLSAEQAGMSQPPLPIPRRPLPPPERSDGEASGPRPSVQRLLIVEENEELRSSLVEWTRFGDVEVTAVSRRDHAITELQAAPYELMILALDLAGTAGGGLDFLQQLAELGPPPPPSILYAERALSRSEQTRMQAYTQSSVIRCASSQQSLLVETALLLKQRTEPSEKEFKQNVPGPPASAADPILEGKHILLVESDIRNVFTLTNLLEKLGLRMTYAEQYNEVLQQLELHPDIDVVLLDMLMPHTDSLELIHKLRSTSGWKELPILALSPANTPEEQAACLAAGASACLDKPIDNAQLIQILRQQLQTD